MLADSDIAGSFPLDRWKELAHTLAGVLDARCARVSRALGGSRFELLICEPGTAEAGIGVTEMDSWTVQGSSSIYWPGGALFGIIDVLDSEPRNYTAPQRNLIKCLAHSIEQDLAAAGVVEERPRAYADKLHIVRPDDEVRWAGAAAAADIHDAKLLSTERDLVARELDHRIKNFFALADALVNLSARDEPEMKPFAERLHQRFAALGTAHNLIRSRSDRESCSLHGLLRALLSPYENEEGSRITLLGEDLWLGARAVTALALIFHELATNAVKYGALRTPDGKLEIRFEYGDEEVHLLWSEIDTKETAARPAREGFGSNLLGLLIEGQLCGKLRRRWSPRGLAIKITFPLDLLAAAPSGASVQRSA